MLKLFKQTIGQCDFSFKPIHTERVKTIFNYISFVSFLLPSKACLCFFLFLGQGNSVATTLNTVMSESLYQDIHSSHMGLKQFWSITDMPVPPLALKACNCICSLPVPCLVCPVWGPGDWLNQAQTGCRDRPLQTITQISWGAIVLPAEHYIHKLVYQLNFNYDKLLFTTQLLTH